MKVLYVTTEGRNIISSSIKFFHLYLDLKSRLSNRVACTEKNDAAWRVAPMPVLRDAMFTRPPGNVRIDFEVRRCMPRDWIRTFPRTFPRTVILRLRSQELFHRAIVYSTRGWQYRNGRNTKHVVIQNKAGIHSNDKQPFPGHVCAPPIVSSLDLVTEGIDRYPLVPIRFRQSNHTRTLDNATGYDSHLQHPVPRNIKGTRDTGTHTGILTSSARTASRTRNRLQPW